jgi:thioredoxin 1
MKEVNDGNFQEIVLKSENLVAVDFWAQWCGPCKVMTPVLERLSEDYTGRVDFVKCNVDDCPSTSQEYGIRNIPTIIFFRNGTPIDKTVGALPAGTLITKIESLL